MLMPWWLLATACALIDAQATATNIAMAIRTGLRKNEAVWVDGFIGETPCGVQPASQRLRSQGFAA